MATILIVEDTKATQLLTAARLRPYFDIICADNGQDAWDILCTRHIDLVVTDVMMPVMDGYELLRKVRTAEPDMPVMLLTAKQTIEDKKEGYNAGTDDYMTKPFDYDELLMRINALLRRARIAASRRITVGAFEMNTEDGTVTYNGTGIILTRKEFDLLFKFLSYPGKIFTKNELLEDVWGMDSSCSEDTIKTHINRLRNKLAACRELELITIKGFGYKVELQKDGTI